MIRASFLAFLALALATSALAHQQRVATAEIVLNQRSGFIEVAHRFILHDAEHALAEVVGERMDLLGSEAARAQFADYVAGSFVIETAGGEVVLSVLGCEVEGGHIWVYQDAPLPDDVSGLSVRHGAFHEIWPDQRTLVTIKADDMMTSLVFEDELSQPADF